MGLGAIQEFRAYMQLMVHVNPKLVHREKNLVLTNYLLKSLSSDHRCGSNSEPDPIHLICAGTVETSSQSPHGVREGALQKSIKPPKFLLPTHHLHSSLVSHHSSFVTQSPAARRNDKPKGQQAASQPRINRPVLMETAVTSDERF